MDLAIARKAKLYAELYTYKTARKFRDAKSYKAIVQRYLQLLFSELRAELCALPPYGGIQGWLTPPCNHPKDVGSDEVSGAR